MTILLPVLAGGRRASAPAAPVPPTAAGRPVTVPVASSGTPPLGAFATSMIGYARPPQYEVEM